MKNFTFIAILFLISGCGLFKKTTVQTEKTHVSEKTSVASKIDSSNSKTDHTVIVEHEKTDTTVYSKGTKISSSKTADLKTLVNGLNTIDSGLVQVHIQYDTLSKSLKTFVTVKPEAIPVRVDKDKTTYTNTSEKSNKSSATSEKQNIIVDEKTKLKTKEPASMGIIFAIAAFVILIIAGALWWFFGRKAKLVKDVV